MSILIDYKIVKKTEKLRATISSPPNSTKGFSPGLVLILDSEVLEKLGELPLGKERVDYIDGEEFIKSITDHFYIMYNSKRKICILSPECEKYLPNLLSTLFTSLPPEAHLWVGIEIDGKEFISSIDTFISNGFNSPYLTVLSPLYGDIPTCIALSRQNIQQDPNSSESTYNKVLYALEQYKSEESSCKLYARLEPRAIKFLKSTSEVGLEIDKPQKELTGELFVKGVIWDNNKFIYSIDIDKSSVESGQEENVDVSSTRYNFHSHPREAYVRHSVDKAWPSSTDYLGYHQLGEATIFHCVATLEGVYILSFHPHWGNKLKEVDRKFIETSYDIDKKSSLSPEQYVEKINSILYKGFPIYKIFFFPWNKADTIFQIFYPQTGSSCIPSQKIMEKYKKIMPK